MLILIKPIYSIDFMLPHIETPKTTNTQISQGIFILIASLLLYAIQDSFIRSLPDSMSVFQIIFFRSLFSLMPLFILGAVERKQNYIEGPLLKTNFLMTHLGRALLMFISLCCYVMACQHLPLASLYTLSYTSPLFVTILAIPLLGEKIGIYRSTGIIVGFTGILFVLQPGMETFHPAAFLAILSGFFTGASIVLAKRLCQEDSNTLVTLIYIVVCLLGSLIFLPSVWSSPSLNEFITLMMIGLTGGFAQYGFIHAFRLAPASTLAPFDYSGLLWAVLIGYVVWSEIPSTTVFLGSTLVIGGGLITIWRSRKQKLFTANG